MPRTEGWGFRSTCDQSTSAGGEGTSGAACDDGQVRKLPHNGTASHLDGGSYSARSSGNLRASCWHFAVRQSGARLRDSDATDFAIIAYVAYPGSGMPIAYKIERKRSGGAVRTPGSRIESFPAVERRSCRRERDHGVTPGAADIKLAHFRRPAVLMDRFRGVVRSHCGHRICALSRVVLASPRVHSPVTP
jgi:hypothetical protein